MARLLRPGLHSGTVPKLFAKFRRRNLEHTADAAAVTHHLQACEHVEQAVERFIEREFIFLLNQHPAWSTTPLELSKVRIGPTRISIAIACPARGDANAELFFEHRCGWILAGIEQPAWIATLPSDQARLFNAALLGLYKIAGVQLVKEQIEQLVGSPARAFDVSRESLIVWTDANFATSQIHPLVFDDGVVPPTSIAHELLLKFKTISWEDWLNQWNAQ
jgi:hypothetical protein